MTKRHFQAIAAVLKEREPSDPIARETWDQIVLDLAQCLSHFNNEFDRGRFLAACGYHTAEGLK